ncbi:MAG: metal-dependent transcriptional regulator [Candidatus Thermoplasmatota archaeon]|nr:metal-dependent transcriptional regulator [Candidatus Thermoplasmatota archaeon]
MPNLSYNITKRERDCLVALIESLDGNFPTRLVTLSRKMNIKPPTLLEIVRRLGEKGLVLNRSGMLMPTENGLELYTEIVEAHRVLECMSVLANHSSSQACSEASHYDYIMEHETVHALWNLLGKPQKCPHGKKIEVDKL